MEHSTGEASSLAGQGRVHVAAGTNKWWARVNNVVKLSVLKNAGIWNLTVYHPSKKLGT